VIAEMLYGDEVSQFPRSIRPSPDRLSNAAAKGLVFLCHPLSEVMKEIRKPKKSRLATTLLLLGVLAIAGVVLYRQVILPRRAAKNQGKTIAVERTNLPLKVSANGVVKPERSVNLSPKNAGVLQRLWVEEGDSVKQGQLIATMDDSDFLGQQTQAQGQLKAAQANLNKLLAGTRPEDIAQAEARVAQAQSQLTRLRNGGRPEEVAQAEAQVDSAQAQLELAQIRSKRFQGLAKEGAISQDRLDEVLTNERNAKASLNQAQKQLEQVRQVRPEDLAAGTAQLNEAQQALQLLRNGPRVEDIQQARAQVQSARGAVQAIQTQLNDTVIRAPFAGIITQTNALEGSLVVPARPVLSSSGQSSDNPSSVVTLVDTNQVVANVAESNVGQIKVGSPAIIEADAYTQEKFSGQVTQLAFQSVVVQNVTSFPVKVKVLNDVQKLLRPGMNVSVDFQVGQLENAMTVPTVAILRQENGTGVYIAGADQQPIFRPLTTGTTIGSKTVVLSGLTGNEQVFISFPEGFRPKSSLPGLGR
jgi:HlyD family secretion protein